MSNAPQAVWYDWVFLNVFLVVWLGALFLGERFLRLDYKRRAVISAVCFLSMVALVVVRHS